MSLKLVRLGDYCRQERISVRPGDRSELRYIGLETIEANTGQILDGEMSKTPEAPQANSFRFGPEHVLYGKLRPYLNKVALADFEGKCSTEIIPLLPTAALDRRYLAYFLRCASTVSKISERTAGARMPRADMDFVLGLQLQLPSIEQQRRIVDVLSRAEGIVSLRREAQKKAEAVVPAMFVQIFGDLSANTKNWKTVPLNEVSEVISGVAKGRKLTESEMVELPYMRVANVKDGRLDLTEVKKIEIKRSEVAKLLIEPGDLLMTEGGDPDKLGRAALWEGQIDNCVHQNHIFKVRSDRSMLVPEYLRALAMSAYGKGYFLRVAKQTTGIASINKTQLSAFPILLPPLELQQLFAKNVAAVESIQRQQQAASTASEATFKALLARVFSEDLKRTIDEPLEVAVA